ncbi:MAG: CAP domain-containing protein [Deltaproteobacteria bacterium]|nr:CAP domain-containing protein [Deltaproteobacteria bacterium]
MVVWWLALALLADDIPGARRIVETAIAGNAAMLSGDDALDAAARCLLAASIDHGRLASAAIRHCAQKEGVADNVLLPALVMHRGARGLIDGAGQFLRGEVKKRGVTHYGSAIGIADGWAHLVILTTIRRGTLRVESDQDDPIQATLPLVPGANVMFSGTLALDYDHPHALLSTPNGDVVHVPLSMLTPDGRTFAGAVRLPQQIGKCQLEIVAHSPTGPVVIANRALFVGRAPPEYPVPPMKSSDALDDPAQRMLSLINLTRAAHGLLPVALDPDLSAVAELHASAMQRASMFTTYFGHDAPDRTTTLSMRLWAAKIRYSEAAENLAESATVEDAHDTLLSSPGHRDSILNPRFMQVGIGFVKQRLSTGDESIVVVVDFVRE